MKKQYHLGSLFYLVGLLFLSHFAAIAQPTVVSNASEPRHETLSQQVISVLFNTALGGTTAVGQWTVTINGTAVPVTGTAMGGARVNVTFNAAGIGAIGHSATEPFLKPGETLRVSFTNTGNTLKNAALTLNAVAFANIQSKNNWTAACGDLGFFQQGNIPLATVKVCSPVVMDFYQYQYYLSLRVRNSVAYGAGNLINEVTWGDGSPLTQQVAYTSDLSGTAAAAFFAPSALGGNPAVIMTSRATHNYPATLPATGGDCSWNVSVTPALNFAAYIQCSGALTANTTFATYDTDNKNTGTLNLPASVANTDRVCIGTNVNMQFTDATLLNCRVPIEPITGVPNQQARSFRIVYGSTDYVPGNIPDVRVTFPATMGGATVQITNNDATGTFLNPNYFPTTGTAAPDFNGVITLGAPVTVATALTYMGTITTTLTNNQAVGQRFYIRMDYWDVCNPYDGLSTVNAESISNYVEIIPKPPTPVSINKSYCNGTNLTAETFAITAASVAGSTAINWFSALPAVAGNVNQIVNPNGANSTTFPVSSFPGGIVNTTAGTYSLYATSVQGATNTCESNPVTITLTIKEALTTPTALAGPATVCNGVNGTAYSTTPVTGSNPFGGAWNYNWTTTAGFTIAGGTPSASITVNATAAGAQTISTNAKYTTADFLGSFCPSATTSKPVTILPIPVLSSSLTPPAICSGTTFSYTATSATGGTTFAWSRALVPGISQAASSGTGNVSETLTNTTTAAINVTYKYISTAAGCTNGPTGENVVVSVKPTPVLSSSLAPPAICSATTFTYTATSATAGATFPWTRTAIPGINGGAGSSGTAAPNVSEVLTNSSTAPINVTYVFTTTAAGCANPGQNVVVTVNPIPALSSTLTPPAICEGTNFSYTPTSATAGATFPWTRATIAGITPAGPTAGTGNPNETLSNSTTAPITVTYVYRALANGCQNAGQNVQVVINPIPVFTGGATTPICSGSPFSYTPTSGTPGATFPWTRATVVGITPAGPTSGTGDPNETLNNTTTAPINVTYVFTVSANGCNNPAPNNVVVTVNPIPVLTSTLTPAAICSGTSFSYTPTSATGGSTFPWTRATIAGITPAGPTSGTGNPSETLNNSTTAPINVTYVYRTLANGCQNPGQNVVVTVNPIPALSSSLTPPAICEGVNFSYTPTSATGGSTFPWTRAFQAGITPAGPTSGTGNPNETFSNSTTAPITVVYVYRVLANGCQNAGQNVQVVVNPIPAFTSTLTPPPICSGDNFIYTPTSSTAGATFAWTRALVAGITQPANSGSGNPNELLNNTTASAVNVTYAYSVTANGCTNPGPFNVVVSVNPVATLSSSLTPPAICSATTFNYTATSATGGATFQWTRATVVNITPPGVGPIASNLVSETLTNTSTAPINVTYAFTLTSGGCNNTQNVVVVVNPIPVMNSTLTPGGICTANVFSYTPTSLTVGATFAWSRAVVAGITEGATAGAGNVAEVLTNSTASPISVTYKYITTANGCNNGPAGQDVVVSVNPLPLLSTTLTPPAICSGTLFSYAPASATAGATFNWSRAVVTNITPAGPTAGTNNPNETLTNTSTATINVTYAYTLSANGCSNVQNVVLPVNPSPILSSATTAAICSGTVFNYTATSATGGTTFSWTRATQGTINEAGVGPIASNSISETLTNNTTSPVPVTYAFTLLANGCSNPQSVVLTVNPIPVFTAAGPFGICSAQSFSFTPASTTPGASFAWSRAAVGGITQAASSGSGLPGAGGNPNEILTNTTTAPINVTYVYTVSANGCNNPAPNNVVVAVNPIPVLTSTLAPPAICSGTTFTYAPSSATAGATFPWTRATVAGITPAGPTAGMGNPGEALNNTTTAPINVTYVYTTTANGCANPGQNVVVTVNPMPVLSSTLTPAAICSGSAFIYTATSATAGATFAWSRAALGTIVQAASSGTANVNETLTTTSVTPVVVTYVYITSANGCTNAGENVTVTVNPIPAFTSTLAPPAPCSNTLFSYTPTSSTPGATFNWSRAVVAGISNAVGSGSTGGGNANPNEILINTTAAPVNVTYSYTVTANSCPNPGPFNVVVQVNPTPSLSSGLSPPAICSSGSAVNFNYTATSATAGTTFQWSRAAVVGISQAAAPLTAGATVAEMLTNITPAPINVTYAFISTAASCSNTQNVVVTVNPIPALSSSFTPPAICSTTSFNYTPLSATVGSSFAWSRAVVPGITEAATTGTANVSETLTNTTTAPIAVTYVYITTANGCTNGPAGENVVVTVNPIPVLSSTISPPAICSTTAFSYTATSATAGATFGWNRAFIVGISQAGSSGTGNVSEILTNTTTSPISVNYVYITTANGCSNTGQNVAVTVNPLPVLSSSLTPPAICSLSTFNYNATSATAGSTFAWTRAVVAGIAEAASSGTGNVSEVLTNTTTLFKTVTYVYTTTAAGCVGPSQNVLVQVDPTPVIFAYSPAAICSGTAFTVSPANGSPTASTIVPGGTTYAWSAPVVTGGITGGSAQTGQPSISQSLTNPTNSVQTATYTVTPTSGASGSCVGAAFTVNVTVNPKPVIPNQTPAAICSGTTFTVSPANGVPTAATIVPAGTTYTWPAPIVTGGITGGSAMSNQASISQTLTNPSTTIQTATYTVTPTSGAAGSCIGLDFTVTVTVNPTPMLNSTLAPTAICSGTFNYTPTSLTPGSTFAWSRAAVAGIIQGAATGTANVSETLTNVTTSPINVTYVYITTANGCSNSPGENVVVTINPTPLANPILGPSTVCENNSTSVFYSVTANGSNTYSWTVPAGFTISAGGGGATVGGGPGPFTNVFFIVLKFPVGTLPGTPSGTLSVTEKSTLGCNGTPNNLTITIIANPGPVAFQSNPGPLTNFCKGQNLVKFEVTGPNPTSSYTWALPLGGGSFNGPSGGSAVFIDFSAIQSFARITVFETNSSGCAGTLGTLDVTLADPPVMVAPFTKAICSGEAPFTAATPFTMSANLPSTFAWSVASVSAGITGVFVGQLGTGQLTLPLTNTTTAPGTVTFSVKPTMTAAPNCVGAAQTYTITVNPIPTLSSTLTPPAICSGATFGYTPLSATAGATFTWSRALIGGISQAASSGTANVSEVLTNTTAAPINVTYVYVTTANGCSNAGQNVVVTVNPTPVLSSTLAPPAICSATTFNYTATSATAGATFAWSRALVGGISQAAATGTGNVSETLTNTTAAPVNVTYAYITTANGCSNTAQNVVVTVNPTPVLSSTLAPAAICSATTFSYTATSATVGATFAWSRALVAGISQAASSGAGNVSETLTNTTTAPVNVTYAYITTANGCSNTAQNVVVVVNPTPNLSSSLAPAAICSATTFTYTATSATAGATFAWSRALVAGITEAATASTGNVSETLNNTTAAPIAVTYVYITTANGCSNAGQNVVVTVNPIPVLSSTLTPVAICSGAAFGYTATSATVGATFTWTRALVAGITPATSSGTTIVSEVLTNTTTAPVNVTYVYITTANGCSNGGQNVVLTVNPTPVLSSSLTPPAICSTATFNYTATSATAGATFAWSRALVGGISQAASSGTGNVSETLTNTTTAPINVTYAYITTANGCSNTAQNVIVTVNPIPVLSSTLAPAAICSATTFTYTVTSATVGATFAWSRALVGGISQAANSGTGNVSETLTNTTAAPIVVTYVYTTTANTCSNPQSVLVTVNPTPVLSSTLAPAAICSATTFSYTATSATAGATFAWSRALVAGITEVASSGTANVSEILTNTTTAPINVTYAYITTANGCSNPAQNVVVTVNPTPVLSSTLTPPAICSATTFNYTATSATAGATFAWSRALIGGISQAAASGTANVSELLTNTTTAPINVTYVYVTTANGCSNAGQNVVVTVNPTPVLSSTLTPAGICSATTFSYTATSATAGATFAWTRALVAGISQAAGSGAGNVSETLTNTTTAPVNVTYAYITTANGCSDAAQNVVVTVNPTPVLSSTLTPAAICSATTFSYTATSATAGATFAWTRALVAGISQAASSGTGNVSEVLTNTTTAPVNVTYAYVTTANGCSDAAQNVVVTVNPTPVLSSTLTPAAICSATTFSYTATSATGGATFAWTRALVAGISQAASSGTGNVSEILTNTTTAPINVTYVYVTTANLCNNSPGQNVVITVNPIPVLSSTLAPPAICSGTAFGYTATSATGGATFAWTRALLAGISQAASSGTTIVSEVLTNTTTAPINVTYVYITTANGCSNAGQNVVLTVNPTPVLSSSLTPPPICSTATFSYTATSATAGATFAWSRALVAGISQAASSGAGNISEILTNTTTAPIAVTYVYTTTANGCSSAPQNVAVTVNPIPVLSSTLTPAAICSATTFSYTATSATAGATFAWSRALVAGISQAASSGAGNVSETLTNTTTAPIVVTYVYTTTANTCSNPQSVVVTVNPIPVLSSTLTPAPICSTATFSYTATSATVGATFAWTRALVAGISQAASSGTGNVSEVLTNTTTAPINVTYAYITTANGCSNIVQNVVLIVNPTPNLSSTLTPPAICSGATFGYTPASATAGATFAWSRALVAGISQAASSGVAVVSELLTNTTTAPINVTYVYVTTANGCSNAGQNVVVTVNPTPVLSSTLTPAGICSATTFSYTATSATAGATFAWTRALVAGISQAAGSGAGNVSEMLTNTTVAPINVTYAYITTANGCSSAAQNVVVAVNPIPVLSSTLTPAAICSATTFNYTATSATPGATFTWSRALVAGITEAASSGVVANVSETLTNTTTAFINVTYVFITTANGCSNPQNVIVRVNPIPVLSSTLTPATICGSGSSVFSYTPTSVTAGATFAWSRALVAGITEAASSGTGNVSETLTNTTTGGVNVTYVYITTANGCSNAGQNVVVTISPIPALSSTLTPPAICSTTTFNYTATSATTGTTFAWSRAAVGGISQGASAGTGNIGETLTNTTVSPINVTYAYILSANGCTNTPQNVVVSVSPIPVLSSTLTPPAICSAATFSYTATSATAGATFAWSRAAVAGITQGASSGVVAGVSEILTNTTTSPIVVTYVFTTSFSGCNNPQNVVVTVNPSPVLSSTLTPAAICGGTTFSYTATSATAGATFAWSRALVGGISQAASSGTANVSETLSNTTTAPINVTYVYITTANGCSSPGQNVVITVNPVPVLSSTLTPAAICSGTTFTYTASSATAGATFAWSRALVAGIAEAASSGTANVSETLTNTTTAFINVTYVYTTTANGCIMSQNVIVRVNPIPLLSSALVPPAICSATAFNYTATSATAGATFAWSRALIAGITEAASSSTGNVSETLTNTTTAPIVVTYAYVTTANTCVNPQNVTVTVNPIPVLSSALTPAAICSGTAFGYTATSATAGATFTWTRAVVAGITQPASSGTTIVSEVLSNTTTAPINVTYVYITTANGCSNTGQNVVVTVNPIPVLSSTLVPPAICSATNFSYTPSSVTVGATFAWSRAVLAGITQAASSGTGNVSETLTNTTTAPINVTYAFVTTANGCSNAPGQNVVVTVNPTPVLSSTLIPAAICSGTTFSYTATSATAGATFAWSRALVAGISQGATSGVGNVSEILSNTTTAPINVTYVYVTTANLCNNSPGQNVVITVNPKPVLSSSLTPPAICSLTTFSYTATSATVGATFAWSRAAVAGISEAASSGTGNVSETLTNATTAPINVTYLYITTANGCSNTAQNVVVVVNPIPVLTSTLTPPAICSATTFTYTATSATAGATFAWSRALIAGITEAASSGAGNISETLTNTTTAPINVTYVYVTTANLCNNAPGQNVVVTVNPIPVLTSTLTPPAICSLTTFTYTATSATAGATFAWSRASLAGISQSATVGTGNVSEILTNTTTAPISVTYVYTTTANGCSNAGENVVVVVNPIPVLSSTLTPAAICSGATFTYTASSATAGATFAWSRAAVAGISQAAAAGAGNVSETLTNTTTAFINVTYVYTTSANGCSKSQNVVVRVNPIPVLSSTLTPAAICSGTAFVYISTSATTGATFAWSRASVVGIAEAASSGTASVSETLTNTTTAPIIVTYVYITTANLCNNSPGQNVVVSVNPTPLLTSTLTPAAICSGTTFTYMATSATVGSTFTWTRASVAGISQAASSGTGNVSEILTNTTASAVSVTYVYTITANGCSNPQSVVVSVNPIPIMSSLLTPVTICSTNTASINITNITLNTNGSSVAADSYTVTLKSQDVGLVGVPTTGTFAAVAGASTAIKNDTYSNTTNAQLKVVYTVVPKSLAGCAGAPLDITVNVNPEPVLFNPGFPAVCSNNTASSNKINIVLATNGSSAGAASYQLTQRQYSNGGPFSTALPASFTITSAAAVGAVGGTTLIQNDKFNNLSAVPVTIRHTIQGTSSLGCKSTLLDYDVIVNPEPTLDPSLSPGAACSGLISNVTLAAAPGSVAAATYNINAITLSPGLTAGPSNSTTGNGKPANAIFNDIYINTTSGPLTMTYTISPVSASGCLGVSGSITLTINPAPAVATGLDKTVCTNNASGIVLATVPLSSVPAASYNIINRTIAGGLVPNGANVAVPASAVASSYLSADKFSNPTNNPLTVTYRVEPKSGANCLGPQKDIVLTVEPTITAAPVNNTPTICSTSANVTTATDIVMASPTTPTAGVITFNYTAVSSVGSQITGFAPSLSSLAVGYRIQDNLVNNSNSSAFVTYSITPVANGARGGSGCTGLPVNVVVNVEPKPKLVATPTSKSVCEGVATGISLTSLTTPAIGVVEYLLVNTVATGGVTGASANNTVFAKTSTLNDILTIPLTPAPRTSQTVTYTLRPRINGGAACIGDDVTVTVTVNPKPNITASAQAPICSGDMIDISLTSDVTNTVSTWPTPVKPATITGASAGAGDRIFQILFNSGNVVETVTYTVTPQVNGCSGTPLLISVQVNPKAKVLGVPNTTVVCHGGTLSIPLTSNVTSGVTFAWTVSDPSGLGIPATGSGATITQAMTNTTGTQASLTYTITPTGPGSCVGESKIMVVTVAPQITAAFLNSPAPDFICKGSTEYLIFQFGGQAPFDFKYNKGGADILVTKKGNVAVIQDTPAATTTYTITSVKDGLGCTTPFSVPLIVNVGDTDPNFTIISPVAVCNPNVALFQYNQVNGTIYTWRFGDTADSTYVATTTLANKVIKHTYTNLSPSSTLKYPVSLQTELPAPYPGCFKSITPKTITIYPNIIASIISDKTEICSGESIQFLNQSVGATSQTWSFRVTGQTAETPMGTSLNIKYAFTNATTANPILYDVIYRGTNGQCPTADQIIPIKVYRSAVAGFNEGTVPPFVNLMSNVMFTNTTSPIDAGAFIYDWTFGSDSSPSDFSGTTPPTVKYVRPGPKEITLTVTNKQSGLCKSVFTKTININLLPLVATFKISPTEGCFPVKVVVTESNITGDVVEWKVVDNNNRVAATSSGLLPTFNLPSEGKYTISLKTSESATGQTASALPQTVTLYPKPFASFAARPDVVYIPDTELSTFNYSTGANKYAWDFGDGGKSTEDEPKYTYKVEGIYDIQLYAQFDHGNNIVCADTLKHQVVAKQGGVTKVPNAFTPNLSGPSGGVSGNGSFNDVFLPIIKGAEEYNLQMFDRWGNMIFESNSTQIGWDGYDKDGRLLPAGVYVYKVTIRLSDGQRTTQIGDVTMIR